MKRLVFVAALLPSVLLAQKPRAATAAYDRVRDSTAVTFDRLKFGTPEYIGSGVTAPPLGLIVSFSDAGQTIAIPDSVELRFVRASMALPGGRGFWRYKGNRTMALLIDDSTRFSSSAVQYDTTVISGLAIENVRFHAPRATVEKLLNAHSAEGVLGDDTHFALTREDFADLRSLLAPVAR